MELKQHVDATPVFDIINTISPILAGKTKLHIILACLTIATNVLRPDITGPELQKLVAQEIEWMTKHVYAQAEAGSE